MGDNGSPGENDQITNVQNVIGGGGSDHLAGNEGPNELSGDAFGSPRQPHEHDVLIGRGGNDILTGGSGSNVLVGGPGNDWLLASNVPARGVGPDRFYGGPGNDLIDLGGGSARAAPFVSCGSGNDRVLYPAQHSLIPRDCETVQPGESSLSTHLTRITQTLIAVNLINTYGGPAERVATVYLYGPFPRRARHPRLLGVGSVRVKVNRHQRVLLHLTRRGSQLLRDDHHTKVLVGVGYSYHYPSTRRLQPPSKLSGWTVDFQATSSRP